MKLGPKELAALKTLFPADVAKPRALFEYLVVLNRFTSFPNVFIALGIYLKMPVTVASGERSFSTLKLIKTYLLSTISQERLNNLAMLSIELTLPKLWTSKLFSKSLQKRNLEESVSKRLSKNTVASL